MGYLFGPVLSRRLGLSMGVDLLKYKTCNLDCVYCELGRTVCLTVCRDRFVPREKVIKEIEQRRDEPFDYLTFAGSGEPTLSLDLGDVVCASQESFSAINRPAEGLFADKMIQGLKDFRREFSGEIWLEVMLVRGINDHEAERIARAAEAIEPDRIQLNTVVRTPAEPVEPLSREEMHRMLEIFPGAELIPDWDWSVPERIKDRLLELLSGRECTLDEIGLNLDLGASDAIKYCKILEKEGMISRRLFRGNLYFHLANDKLI
ncbi:MAG: radical SAM protein [Methanothrix sp.]|nr:radical SAM protein [Methanothrix sp.]